MDDVYLFGASWSQLRRIQLRASDAMRELGLEMNTSKTQIFEGLEMKQRIDEVEASGVAKALFQDNDCEPLLDRARREIAERAESSERTTISHTCALARESDLREVAELLAEVAERLPHGADHLADLLRYFEMGGSMQAWFLRYQTSDWGEQHWAVAHLAAIFTADLAPSEPLVARFGEMLAKRSSTRAQLPTTQISALRLCAWENAHRLDHVREALKRTSHPQEIRLLALLGLTVGEERAQVRKWLGAHPDNSVTLAMLEDRNFKVPPLSKLA